MIDATSNSALREINAALALTPADPDAHNTKAIVCAERGDLICARNEWTYLIRVDPEYAPAHANLAILNRSQNPPLSTTSASKGLDAESLAFAH